MIKTKLRSGFSTGACVTAATIAAYNKLLKYSQNSTILFLDGIMRNLEAHIIDESLQLNYCSAFIIKDAGDDPDVTNNAKIVVSVALNKITANMSEQQQQYAHNIIINNGCKCIIYAKEGVGIVERIGLPVAINKYAINPKPIEMICNNLVLIQNKNNHIEKNIFIEISIINGEEIAKKTLNSRLGIIGGLSILGTTGIVKPYSHDAYITSVQMHLNSLKMQKYSIVAISTGNATNKGLLKDFKDAPYSLDEENCLRIGDFIADTLKHTEKCHFKTIIVGCMFGKLYKYGCGFKNTHAHKNTLNYQLMEQLILQYFKNNINIQNFDKKQIIKNIKTCTSVRQMMGFIPEKIFKYVINQLLALAMENLIQWNKYSQIIIALYNHDGILIKMRKNEKK